MKYTYRCRGCGYEIEQEIAASDPLPEMITVEHWRPDGDHLFCLRRLLYKVFEVPNLNLGFRAGYHDRSEEFRFRNL